MRAAFVVMVGLVVGCEEPASPPSARQAALTEDDVVRIVNRVVDEREAAEQKSSEELAERMRASRQADEERIEKEYAAARERERELAELRLSPTDRRTIKRIRDRLPARGLYLSSEELGLMLGKARPLLDGELADAIEESRTPFGELAARLKLSPREKVSLALRLGGDRLPAYESALRVVVSGGQLTGIAYDDPAFIHVLEEHRLK